MKKTIFAILLAFVASANTQAQSIAGEETIQKVRQVAEQHLDVFNGRDYDSGQEYCDCKKCQKGKKSKKHQGCNQRGNHYGKHKNHHDKNSCCCENRKKRDCDDDDHRGYGSNGRDRDDNDRRYEENRRDRNPGSNSQTRAGQKTSTAKVKTRPTPTAKPTSAPTSAKKRATSRPTSGR